MIIINLAYFSYLKVIFNLFALFLDTAIKSNSQHMHKKRARCKTALTIIQVKPFKPFVRRGNWVHPKLPGSRRGRFDG